MVWVTSYKLLRNPIRKHKTPIGDGNHSKVINRMNTKIRKHKTPIGDGNSTAHNEKIVFLIRKHKTPIGDGNGFPVCAVSFPSMH